MRIATKAGGPFNALGRQFTIEFKVFSEGASAFEKALLGRCKNVCHGLPVTSLPRCADICHACVDPDSAYGQAATQHYG